MAAGGAGAGAGAGAAAGGWGCPAGWGGGGAVGAAAGVGPSWPRAASSTTWRGLPRAVSTAFSSRGRRVCTIAIQLPATATTARFGSSLARVACWESSMRVEGSSSPARICCQSSCRLGPGSSGAVVAAVAAVSSTAVSTAMGRGLGRGAGSGRDAAGWAAAGGVLLRAGAATLTAGLDSASSPSSSTSSHSRGCTLWRSCCSLPLSCACHCSRRVLPMLRAMAGSCGRNWGEKLVSSSRSGAVPASTRSRSSPARPWRAAAGSRPRSSRVRIASITPRGSAAARAVARLSSSCSGTAPTRSQTAAASIGAGSRLS